MPQKNVLRSLVFNLYINEPYHIERDRYSQLCDVTAIIYKGDIYEIIGTHQKTIFFEEQQVIRNQIAQYK